MKRLIISALAVILTAGISFGQSKTIQKFHEKYKDDRDATVVTFTGGLFKLLATVASLDEQDEDSQVISRIADNISSLELVSIPMYKSGFKSEDIAKMRSELKKEKYEEMMTLRDGSDHIYFMTQGSDSEIKNMLILISEESDFMVMNVNGELDLKDLAYLAKKRNNLN
ncbi:DUF4252 domain-containing protein [Fulvivirga sediminis]|uniref:DUF4252 domain-containing protein n=1 Tax=Fulvivirga sediminis TaxID=2803949 RepID=A0A937FC01_9BACT|nr:DUF4252 domain-containing protein [Fulvivirga sediminis]MBL3658009.1 DUF4252 domain-containing protein [Fulvivirga sediminis]